MLFSSKEIKTDLSGSEKNKKKSWKKDFNRPLVKK